MACTGPAVPVSPGWALDAGGVRKAAWPPGPQRPSIGWSQALVCLGDPHVTSWSGETAPWHQGQTDGQTASPMWEARPQAATVLPLPGIPSEFLKGSHNFWKGFRLGNLNLKEPSPSSFKNESIEPSQHFAQ